MTFKQRLGAMPQAVQIVLSIQIAHAVTAEQVVDGSEYKPMSVEDWERHGGVAFAWFEAALAEYRARFGAQKTDTELAERLITSFRKRGWDQILRAGTN